MGTIPKISARVLKTHVQICANILDFPYLIVHLYVCFSQYLEDSRLISIYWYTVITQHSKSCCYSEYEIYWLLHKLFNYISASKCELCVDLSRRRQHSRQRLSNSILMYTREKMQPTSPRDCFWRMRLWRMRYVAKVYQIEPSPRSCFLVF